MNDKEFLGKIKNVVLQYDDKARVILFGSRARGDHKEDSDWDLLVLTEMETNADFTSNLIDKIFELELEFTQAVSPIIVDKQTWEDWAVMPLYKNIAKEGIAV
jgi:predicted nucleotidyltransferase